MADLEYFLNSKLPVKLFTTVSELTDANVVISTLSLQLCLATIYLLISSKDEAKSSEILKFLHLSTKTTSDDILEKFSNILKHDSDFFKYYLYNKFLIDNKNKLNQEFIQKTLSKLGETSVDGIDFLNVIQSNVDVLNKEFLNKTNDKISQILTKDDFNNVQNMMIASASTLNAKWDATFHNYYDNDGKDEFYLTSGTKVDVDMMTNTIPFFKYGNLKNYKMEVAEFNYAGHYENELAMLILLPYNDSNINELEKLIEDIDIFDLVKNHMESTPMWIKFPKFKIQHKINSIDIFEKIQPNLLKDKKFNFGNLIENDAEMKVDKIIHKAAIESNLVGTDSNDAPRHLAVDSAFPNIVHFHANRPFIFIVKDNKSIYFMGKVINPQQS